MAHEDVSTLTYEAARDQLAEVVRTLESGSATLEDSLKLWERGEALAAHCQSWLDGARRRLDAASRGAAAPAAAGSSAPSAPSPADLDALEEADDAAELEAAALPEGGQR